MNSTRRPINVLLVDDHALFRSGIRSLLQPHPDLAVVGEAADGIEGVSRARQLQPDVVVLDLHMPRISSLETLQLLRACPKVAVIVLTDSKEPEGLTAALRAGARGYLSKDIDADYLAQSIRRAASGETVLAETMSANPENCLPDSAPKNLSFSDADRLTPREREILACLAQGESNKTIARTLDLAESTVKIHVQHILKKLNLSSRVQAAVFAVEHGMAGMPSRQT